jgi:addiction module RelE/StbE family toxin
VKLIWTPAAKIELLKLVSYVYPRNRSAALRLYVRTHQKVRQLEKFPYSGRPGRMTGTRELVIGQGPYVAVYVVESEGVTIHSGIHTSQQWPPEE